MEQKINPDMLVLAREFRELTQSELAKKTNLSQPKITRLESGISNELTRIEINRLAEALEFPCEFFFQKEEIIGYGSSSYFYRKKAKLTASDKKRIHAKVNMLRINIKRLLQNVDIKPKRNLPRLPLEEYGLSPHNVAQALRGFWRLPEGPITNLTGIMESAGIIVVVCQFGTRAMDATSLWIAELPPIIFINEDLPGDRWRFTLAHELGHLVMHDGAPYEAMEDEADNFASEFLVPDRDFKSQFKLKVKPKLSDFANLKLYWKVSMGMLMTKALHLDFITDAQRRYFYMNMNRNGNRAIEEPFPIAREDPQNHRNLMNYYQNEIKYSLADFLKFFMFTKHQDLELHPVSFSSVDPPRHRLHLIQ